LSVFKDHEKLFHVAVHDSSLGDLDIPELLQINSLRTTHLGKTRVTHQGLRELAAHAGRELARSNQQRSEEDVAALKLFERLDVLKLDGTGLPKESIDELPQAHPHCRSVWDRGVIERSQVREHALLLDGHEGYVALPIT